MLGEGQGHRGPLPVSGMGQQGFCLLALFN